MASTRRDFWKELLEERAKGQLEAALKTGGGSVFVAELVLSKYSKTRSIISLHERQWASGTWISKISQDLREPGAFLESPCRVHYTDGNILKL